MVLKRPFIICKFWESRSRSGILEPQSDNESESQSSESDDFEPRRDRSRLINPNSTTESESQSDFMVNQSGSQSSDESESQANNDFQTSSFGSVRPKPLFWFRSDTETQIGRQFRPIP